MKTKTVFAASLLLAGAAFATAYEYTNDSVIGVMPVSSEQSETIVAVPWVGDGVNGEVSVTNLVKTAGLAEGDALIWYDTTSGKYVCWHVGTARDGVSYWVADSSITENASIQAAADDPAIKQGQAVIVRRATPSSSTKIYVIGEVGSSSAPQITINPGYNLIAPPSTSETDLNAETFDWSGVGAGDMIYVNTRTSGKDSLKVYTYEEGKWGETTYQNREWSHSTTAVVPAGQGFYYYRAGNSSLNITWSGVPAVTTNAN
jgi:hypothetical protein